MLKKTRPNKIKHTNRIQLNTTNKNKKQIRQIYLSHFFRLDVGMLPGEAGLTGGSFGFEKKKLFKKKNGSLLKRNR